ncbi:class II aaRS and biotin synthetase, partial [Polyplosphaeria fusca]
MLVVLSRFPKGKPPYKSARCLRYLSVDSRSRLSTFWAPTGGRSPQDGDQDDSHALLVRGGFLRQAHSGVFHLLPLGLRVQHKLETLIDKHMESIGASKISLSSISTEELWRQSGRYSANSELLRVNDRRESGFLLSPTHEEEITSLASGMIQSYKDLPLRLYQIGRKYRDEKRPRQGLLRAKEFLMKDLYTFDFSQENALATYELVRQAYNNLFDELNIPYLVANADSGNMGGKLSHEYHFASPKGEDNVWSCDSCSYAANEEVVEQRCDDPSPVPEAIFEGISTDRKTKIIIHIPAPEPHTPSTTPLPWSRIHKHVNLHAIKRLSIPIDTGIEPSTLHSLLAETTSQLHVHDLRTPASSPSSLSADLTALHPGSPCPSCASGHLHARKAIEVAHTFHLGTRYSAPLSALVSLPNSTAGKVPMHMGCHGIGVSRMMGAMAALLADGTGLNWPRVVAPFECLVASTGAVV